MLTTAFSILWHFANCTIAWSSGQVKGGLVHSITTYYSKWLKVVSPPLASQWASRPQLVFCLGADCAVRRIDMPVAAKCQLMSSTIFATFSLLIGVPSVTPTFHSQSMIVGGTAAVDALRLLLTSGCAPATRAFGIALPAIAVQMDSWTLFTASVQWKLFTFASWQNVVDPAVAVADTFCQPLKPFQMRHHGLSQLVRLGQLQLIRAANGRTRGAHIKPTERWCEASFD